VQLMTRPMHQATVRYAGPPHDPNRYRVGDPVGRGGEGEVARGVLLVEGAPVDVAIKMWRHPGGDLGGLRARELAWERQVRLVQSIQHPGVVRVRESFVGAPPHAADCPLRPGHVLYLIMNWADGVPLCDWVEERPDAGYDDVCAVTAAVASAVAHLHSGYDTGGRPILHRDLKPGNVIVSESGDVQLVDFGLARGANRPASVAGTPGYLAPEVVLHGRFSEASDMFGLGAIAYFLVVGADPPTQPLNAFDLAPIRARLRNAPMLGGRQEGAEHIAWAMDPDPAHRPTDAEAWAAGLRGSPAPAIRRRPPPPLPALFTTTRRSRPTPRARALPALAAAVFVGVPLAGFTGAGMLARVQDGPPAPPGPLALSRTSYQLPGDASPMPGGRLGPVCCHGRALTVNAGPDRPVGYVHLPDAADRRFAGARGESMQESVSVVVFGLRTHDAAESDHAQARIVFRADRPDRDSGWVSAGVLQYRVTVTGGSVGPTTGCLPCFDEGSLALRVDVRRVG
jgi:serine/threonine protein kinase